MDVKVPAQWSQFHVPLASCKTRLDLYSNGEVFSTYGKVSPLAASYFLDVNSILRKGGKEFPELIYQSNAEFIVFSLVHFINT